MTTHRVRAGKLRHEVELYTLAQTSDGGGGRTEAYSLLATVFASIERFEETEEMNAGMQQNVTTHQIKIRYCDGLSVSDQVRFGSRRFEIIAIDDIDQRNYAQELMCVERSI